jgi:hypothetical protein
MSEASLVSLLPLVMLGNVDTKVLMLLSTFALSCFVQWYPLETMLAEARLLFNKYTLNTISFEIVGIAVGKYDISMSNSFQAVMWRIHERLDTSAPDDPIWNKIHDVSEINMSLSKGVCRIFTQGSMIDEGVTIKIRKRVADVRPGRGRDSDSIEISKETWTLTLQTSTTYGFTKIANYIEDSVKTYDLRMKKKRKQTLFDFSRVSSYDEVDNFIFEEHAFKTTKNFDNLFFPKKAELMRKLDMFENNEDMYARLGKPYKFYMMFHGEHGCAKTSVIKAIASLTGKHVVVLRLDRFKDVIEMCRTITKFSSQESIDYKDCMFVVEEFDCFNHDYIKRSDTRDAGEKDVETASIETSVVMVDTKATTEAKKEHEAKKSALGTLLNTFDGVRELHGCMVIFTTNKPEDFDPALVRPGRIELMHFGRLNAIDIMDYWKLTYGVTMPARVSDALGHKEGIISLADLSIILERDPLTAGDLLIDLMVDKS